VLQDQVYGTTGTSLKFTDAAGTNGTGIDWLFQTGWDDLGVPDVVKQFNSITRLGAAGMGAGIKLPIAGPEIKGRPGQGHMNATQLQALQRG
jgi:hypothetical protein